MNARSCVFCAIAAEEEPAYVVATSGSAVAFLDADPAADGHTLVIPRAHATDIWDIGSEDGRAVWTLAQEVATLLRDRLRPDGMTLFQANRRAGWQHVFHLHVHVVPRWETDGLVMPWVGPLVDPARVPEIAARLQG